MNRLQKLLTFNESLPFLFIGSGFTRRYLDTPDWIGLLEHFASLMYPDNDLIINQYMDEAKKKLITERLDPKSTNNINSMIADLIESEFNDMWYKDERFALNRKKSASLIKQGHTPFKIEIAEYFKEALENNSLNNEELNKLKLLSGNSIAGIITTNYDCLLETFFDFTTYIGQEELLFSSTQNICELYKIHGCVSSPSSIIIDSNDYNLFSSRSKYLASKLLTIFVEHPIIFIGYSITDENIRKILDDIIDCLNPEQLVILKSRFFFIDRALESNIEESQIDEVTITSSRKEITMTRIRLKDFGYLYELLSYNKTQYPVKWLRKLKENVYNLVTSTTPSDKLKIMIPFEQLDNTDNVEFVVGVGISQAADLAYASYSAEEIFLDVVFNNRNFNPDLLIEKTLPAHISRTAGSMPFYKYLSTYSKSAIPECLKKHITDDIDHFYNRTLRDARNTLEGNSIDEIVKKHDFPKNLHYIIRLPVEKLDVNQLEKYLRNILKDNSDLIKTGGEHIYSSDIRRLIKIYDWMMFHKIN